MAVARLPQHGTLARMAREQLEREIVADTKAKTKRDFFRGSETFECERRLMWARNGEKVTVLDHAYMRSKANKGNVLHDWFRQWYIPRYLPGWKIELSEEELDFKTLHKKQVIKIRSHKDGILVSPEGKRYLFELKTTSRWGYEGTMKAKLVDPSHYSEHYRRQANRYYFIEMALKPKKKLAGVVVIVFNVNGDEDETTGVEWRDFWFGPDQKLWQEDLDKRARIERLSKAGQTPPRAYDTIGWECAGALPCPWLWKCWPKRERVYSDSRIAKMAKKLVPVE